MGFRFFCSDKSVTLLATSLQFCYTAYSIKRLSYFRLPNDLQRQGNPNPTAVQHGNTTFESYRKSFLKTSGLPLPSQLTKNAERFASRRFFVSALFCAVCGIRRHTGDVSGSRESLSGSGRDTSVLVQPGPNWVKTL